MDESEALIGTNPAVIGTLIGTRDIKSGGTISVSPKEKATYVISQVASVSQEVEDRGLEPLTFWLPARRSPN